MYKLRVLVTSLLLITLSAAPKLEAVSATPAPLVTDAVETRELSDRGQILYAYLDLYGSPLKYHAQDFVDAADKYGVDWKLVPAISGVESTFGKASYGYNAWGWGIYGDQRLNFGSWKAGIYTVTAGLKTGYIDRGLTDPYSINRVYAASPTWGWRVNYFMNDLQAFAIKYSTEKKNPNVVDIKIAASSASLSDETRN